ncbi:MAG: ABC transporter permease, partial [Clostridia bacterium]|nr:ABC transporter permease [Clostridia bacterium]
MSLANVLSATFVHLRTTFLGVLLGCAVGLPAAVLLMKHPKLSKGTFYVIDAIQTVPTLAMLTFVMLVFGLNNSTVVVAVFLYSLFPIVRNASVGLNSIDPGIIRAGRGIGMNPVQVLTMIRLPLAMPMILSGIRLAVVS